MEGGGFLSQGGYGCVFYPEVNCRGRDTNNKRFISKIVEEDFSARNEIKIGRILQEKTKQWVENPLINHFAPVLSSCPLDVSHFHMEGKGDCGIFQKSKASQFTLMKIRYIDGSELDSFITENYNSSLITLLFTSSYMHLLNSIKILSNAKICHFDIKAQNIVFDKPKSLPIVIDFGLSIDMSQFDSKDIYNYFYIYEPAYYIWPLEVHLVNYILHVDETLTESGLRSIAKEYTSNNVALRSFSPSFRAKYQQECIYELSKYKDHSASDTISRVMKYWHTWDNYALSLLYLKLIYYLIRGKGGLIIKNKFVGLFTQLCLTNIHPNPKKRLSINDSIKTFNMFLYNQQVDKESVFEDIIEQIQANKPSINRIVERDRKFMERLSKKTERRKIV